MTYVPAKYLPLPTCQRIFAEPETFSVYEVKHAVALFPEMAQTVLEGEYRNQNGVRYSLVQWLKRHRLHNPTVRAIKPRA